jgi:hypothetical protein
MFAKKVIFVVEIICKLILNFIYNYRPYFVLKKARSNKKKHYILGRRLGFKNKYLKDGWGKVL